jgi:hypothetical protein
VKFYDLLQLVLLSCSTNNLNSFINGRIFKTAGYNLFTIKKDATLELISVNFPVYKELFLSFLLIPVISQEKPIVYLSLRKNQSNVEHESGDINYPCLV